jgi:5'-methylthioadenosine phosphorylase
MTENSRLAVIGGSGLYQIPDLTDIQEHRLATPFGVPSAPIIEGTLSGKRVYFLARHGLGHTISPSEINYRANIFAIKSLGVERVISVSACGSLRDDYRPGDLVIPDQVFDFSHKRARSFFENGLVAHVSVADPFCESLSSSLESALIGTGAVVHTGGTFITIEGPRFSTRAESNIFRTWGMSLIGMTTSPEAFLAKEAEICYSVMAHVTDFDVWHISEEPVTVEMVIEILNQNTKIAQKAIRTLVMDIDSARDCECKDALAGALITSKSLIPDETRDKLGILINRYLD